MGPSPVVPGLAARVLLMIEAMRPGTRLTATFICLAIVTGACGSDGDDDSASGSEATAETATEDPRSESDLAADQAAADSAVLVLSDFPAGWTAEARDEDEDEGPDIEAEMAECLALEDPGIFEDSAVQAESDTFKREDAEVEGDLAVQATDEKAEEAVAVMSKPEMRDCLTDALRAVLDYAIDHPAEGEELPDGVEIGDVSVGDLSFGDVGDFSRAFRAEVEVTAEEMNISVFVDLLFFRVGRGLATMTFQDVLTPFDVDEAHEIATTFASKIELPA